ncbi:MFS transporter [Actinoplanes sp. NPDC051343]|uniref:MFS transporter n=1 Tax=Actinoplanes sp. NPDC051343 TaxID=3363906 RepID=UPI0037A049F8
MSVRRGRAALLAALGIDMAGTGLFAPISLLYFQAVTDLSLPTIGLLISVATIASLPVPVVVGHLVDRYGPRGIVITAQVLQGVGFAAYVQAHGPVSVLVPSLIVTVGQRMFWCSVFTLVTEVAPPGRGAQDRTFALFSMVQSAGLGAGSLIAGLALSGGPHAYRLVVVINAASYLVSAAALYFVPRAPRVKTDKVAGSYRDLLRDRPYLGFIAVNGIFNLVAVMVGTAVPVYVVEGLPAPQWLAGPLLTFNTVLLATGQTLAVRLVRRLPRTRALALAGAFMVVWALAMALAVRIPGALLIAYLPLSMAFFAAGELIMAPVANALASAAAPDHLRGRYLAVMQYGFAVAQIIAPTFFTVLYTRGRALPFVVLAAVTAGASVLIARSSLGAGRSEGTLPAEGQKDGSDDPRTGENEWTSAD